MELKKYQQDVLSDIDLFNGYLDSTSNLRTAFREFWSSKGVTLTGNDDYLHEYVNTVPGVPRVTVKVPTAGGKTFIACNAIKNILDSFPDGMSKVVVWFVPSDPILQQTYKRLNDPSDPYRQKIDTLFNGRVRVYDKESLLRGNNFNPVIVGEQLSILVLSIQSFASNDNEGRRSRRENENLTEFVNTYTADTHKIADVDETALLQVIASLNPVVIIDESHNFTADLRVETLIDINPRYILELTATPRTSSNIISFVDASRLKRENMVKLPVIVYNHTKIEDVIMGSIHLQRKLEEKAKECQSKGGDYVRPIVLFQAQPKNSEDNATFDKVKKELVDIGIPESQIKIKTAKYDELKGIDLLSHDCQVRYIITVDALKEGWDCPFAYILASLANKTSKISVEQILGRILRQPYTRQQLSQFLNLSYVLTCSADFQNTLSSIVTSLNNSGFSARDYRAVDQQAPDPKNSTDTSTGIEEENLFSSIPDETETENVNQPGENGTEDLDKINTSALKSQYEHPEIDTQDYFTEKMLGKADDVAKEYYVAISNSTQNDMPADLIDRVKSFPMKELFKEEASKIRLPQFTIRPNDNVFFADDILLTPNHMLNGFKLSTCDKNIEFECAQSHTAYIDLETQGNNEFVPTYRSLNEKQLKAFGALFSAVTSEERMPMLKKQIFDSLQSKFNEIEGRELLQYIEDVLKSLPDYKLQELADNLINTKKAFEDKIKALAAKYKKDKFKEQLDKGKVKCRESFILPERIVPKDSPIGLSKSLYKEENKMDDFERRVIAKIADLDNVLFWHRNFEKGRGFFINGFINHYPDFIVVLKSGHILMIETKGDHLDGSDSEDKIELGNLWATKAGDRYRYYMVFDHKEVPNAKTLPELLGIIKEIE